MTSTTAPSSAEIVPFPTADKPTFAVASKAWLKTTQTHPLLTDANKTFCTALYFYFNVKHYQRTGELIAWPGWDTLITEFGLSKETINESIGQVERFQLLNVERNRYDRATHRRAGNLYRVPQGQDFGPYQGQNSRPDQGQNSRQDSYDSPSPLGERIDSVKKEGLPREVRPKKLTEKELVSLERLAARINGGGQ
jgi:hypothetical protein